ncbi:MAG: hypothetical protein E2O39_08955 [Planctomycetota bacterium]|nr:MAG: hypothetical protein E2O39_08955 [Planctomycetota bacterium]
MHGATLLPLGASLALALPLWLQPAAEEPRLLLEDLAGKVTERPLAGLSITDPRDEGAAFVRFAGFPEPAGLGAEERDIARVLLGNGDALTGVVAGGDGDRLRLRVASAAVIDIAVEEMASLVFPGRILADGGAPPVRPEQGDRLYHRRGRGLDRVDGLVQSFAENGVRFESRFGQRLYGWDEVAALFVEVLDDVERADRAASDRVPVAIDLRGPYGPSRLRGDLLGIAADGCRIATRGNPALFLPAEIVAEIAVDDGSFRFLSELPPSDAGPVSPFGDTLGYAWPFQVDHAVGGKRPLRAGGRTWARGIGVHAPSRLEWTLDGDWKELRCLAAIDDQVLERSLHGSVVFRVLVDGEERFASGIVRGGDEPLTLPPIDLTGARSLVLEVGFATDHFASDRADWLRPILVR